MEIYYCLLILKENTILNFFYYVHIVEISTNKGANSYKLKLSKIWNILNVKPS